MAKLTAQASPMKTRAPRSAVTTGRRQFVVGDGRSAWALRYSDLVQQHVEDLGGAESISSAQLSLARRAATIECQLEDMEGQLSLGDSIDLDLFVRATGALNRVLKTLGIERRKPDATIAEAKRLDAIFEASQQQSAGSA
jgi:hypothetical protein